MSERVNQATSNENLENLEAFFFMANATDDTDKIFQSPRRVAAAWDRMAQSCVDGAAPRCAPRGAVEAARLERRTDGRVLSFALLFLLACGWSARCLHSSASAHAQDCQLLQAPSLGLEHACFDGGAACAETREAAAETSNDNLENLEAAEAPFLANATDDTAEVFKVLDEWLTDWHRAASTAAQSDQSSQSTAAQSRQGESLSQTSQ